ncbi:TPA: magnesium transporter [Candidatus Dependentiae bacterium]|nr:magnesium transporter [Candidatus Dependentiae bacterium]HBZ73499.1 magnesium transporter [Candidatus Dependentiae bacterium]
MNTVKNILLQIENNLEEVLKNETFQSTTTWQNFVKLHPADIASFLEQFDEETQITFLKKFSKDLTGNVFEKLSLENQSNLLFKLEKPFAAEILQEMTASAVTDLFDLLSDEQVKEYLRLLQKEHRKQVISLLNFDPKSAGGIMNSEIFTLSQDISIKQGVALMQRLSTDQEYVDRIYITDRNNKLTGYIKIEDLVLNKPQTLISDIFHQNELIINVHEDQEIVANQMKHYDLLSVPVVDNENNFLGIITADESMDVIEEEASEDVYKMSGLGSVDQTYFQTPFWRLIWQRSFWLITLLILQSASSFVLSSYEKLITQNAILFFFLNMLIGTGGNAGNQSGALVIRGLSTGEIHRKNGLKVLFREFRVAIIIALFLAVIGFERVYLTRHNLIAAVVISISLSAIVVVSIFLGTLLPLLLERLNIDPAHAAAPFLATLMDIIGISIYCIIASKILG